MKANYHTHTKRCGHASGEDREYVESAIEAGLEVLGFADHCPFVYPDGYVSGIRMTPAEVDGYFSSLEGLKKEYEKDIRIYIGFEAEYLPALIEKQKELLSGYPLDYMIQGQHFLGPDKEQVYVGHPFKEEAYLAEYARLSIEGIESGDYLYLAHPDLPHFLGDDKTYRKYMLPVCEALKEENKPAEINILGLADQRHYPVDRFWKLAKEVGVKAVLGVDAHSPAQLLNREGIKQGEQWAEKYGIKLLEKMQELA